MGNVMQRMFKRVDLKGNKGGCLRVLGICTQSQVIYEWLESFSILVFPNVR